MSHESVPNSAEPEAHSVEALKYLLLKGGLEGDVFLEQLMTLDQSTPDRAHAVQNVEVLTSPEVKEFFERNLQSKNHYYCMLSFSHFHLGQIKVFADNQAAALKSFKASLDVADVTIEGRGYDKHWRDYVAGTVSFFEKDLRALRVYCANLPDEVEGLENPNKNILSNFITQLERGEELDYRKGYNRNRLS